MSDPANWVRAYARQAEADFKAWKLLEEYPQAVASTCHKLLLLQMACEKVCKAYLIQAGRPPEDLQGSHGYTEKNLPRIMMEQMARMRQNVHGMRIALQQVRHLAREIELLSPAVRRDGRRPDNCEYPWSVGDRVVSPLDWTFHPTRLLTAPAGRTFIKLLDPAIQWILYGKRVS